MTFQRSWSCDIYQQSCSCGKGGSLPPVDPHDDSALVVLISSPSVLLPSSPCTSAIELEVRERLQEGAEDAKELVPVEDDAALALGCTVATAACARCASVCASRWENNSSSASLATSRTFLDGTRIRLAFSVTKSFEPDRWAMVSSVESASGSVPSECRQGMGLLSRRLKGCAPIYTENSS